MATVRIFLPSFVSWPSSGPLVPRLRESPVAGAFLDGVNVASLALMAVVTWHLGRAAIIDFTTALVVVISAMLLVRFRVNSLWLILGGGLVACSRWRGDEEGERWSNSRAKRPPPTPLPQGRGEMAAYSVALRAFSPSAASRAGGA